MAAQAELPIEWAVVVTAVLLTVVGLRVGETAEIKV